MTQTAIVHSNPNKTRKLSIYEFFQILQNEWMCAYIRHIIYPNPKDKEHWEVVKEGKKMKIQNIANKNALPSIFDDEEIFDEVLKRILQPQGYPKFIYKDETQRMQQEYLDMLHFFNRGIDIRVEINGEIKVCKITSHKPYDKVLKAKVADSEEVVILEICKCTRVMPTKNI